VKGVERYTQISQVARIFQLSSSKSIALAVVGAEDMLGQDIAVKTCYVVVVGGLWSLSWWLLAHDTR